jgi:hypothetical protein
MSRLEVIVVILVLAASLGLPGLGAKLTTTWKVGEVVADRHIVLVGDGAGDERLGDDLIFPGQVEVKP